MLQLSIALLFASAGLASLAVISQTLRRAWSAAGELRMALAQCDAVQPAVLRTVSLERHPALRVIQGAKTLRTVSAPCALRVAA
jgi:hypothetical protein